MTTNITSVRFPNGMLDEINDLLMYGQSRNQWIVDACRAQMKRSTEGTQKQQEAIPNEHWQEEGQEAG